MANSGGPLTVVAYPLRVAGLRRSLYAELRGRSVLFPAVAVLTVLTASTFGFLSEGLPRFLFQTNQWHILFPSLVFGVARLDIGLLAASIASAGWIGTASMIAVGSMQQALLYGAFPVMPGVG